MNTLQNLKMYTMLNYVFIITSVIILPCFRWLNYILLIIEKYLKYYTHFCLVCCVSVVRLKERKGKPS